MVMNIHRVCGRSAAPRPQAPPGSVLADARGWLALTAALALGACGGAAPNDDGIGQSPQPSEPTPAIVISDGSSDRNIQECRATPALPPGMRLEVDPATNACIIVGTPAQESPATMYSIVAVAATFEGEMVDSEAFEVGITVVLEDGTVLSGNANLRVQTSLSSSGGTGFGSFLFRPPSTNPGGGGAGGPPVLVPVGGYAQSLVLGQRFSIRFANTGAPPTTCALATNSQLPPAGLIVDVSSDGMTCAIFGVPSDLTSARTVHVRAANQAGSAYGSIVLEVLDSTVPQPPIAPPSSAAPDLQQPAAQQYALVGASSEFVVENTGGSPDYCTSSTLLPSWLVVRASDDSADCLVIANPPADNFSPYLPLLVEVRAVNSAGVSGATIDVLALPVPFLGVDKKIDPADIRAEIVFNDRHSIELVFENLHHLPLISYRRAGFVDVGIQACHVSPALPSGLVVEPSANGRACVLQGVANINSPMTGYRFSASNRVGTGAAFLVHISVDDKRAPGPTPSSDAPALVDLGNHLLVAGEPVSLPAFANTGGTPDYCEIAAGRLPVNLGVGLSADGGSCVITAGGIEVVMGGLFPAMPPSVIRVRAVNSAGSSTASIELAAMPPVLILDLEGLCELTVGERHTFALEGDNAAPDFRFRLPGQFRGTVRGGIQRCYSEPALPAGLVVRPTSDGASCEIDGVPRAASPQTIYQIFGVNAVSKGSGQVEIVVHDRSTAVGGAPSLIDAFPRLLIIGEEVSVHFDNTGGAPTSCAASPPMPYGLEVAISADGSSCVIVGTPTAAPTFGGAYSSRSYAVTAYNAVGSSLAYVILRTLPPPLIHDVEGLIELTVGDHYDIHLMDVSQPSLSQPDINQRPNRPIYRTSDIGDIGFTSCTSSPGLPVGLTVESLADGWGCGITGTPARATARDTYLITATNDSGSDSLTVEIVVHDRFPAVGAPNLVDISSHVLLIGEEVSLPFTNIGGPPTACAAHLRPSAPYSLPLGLEAAISADGSSCAIVGTPRQDGSHYTYPTRQYEVVASNAVGSSSALATLRIVPPPALRDPEWLPELSVGFPYIIDLEDHHQSRYRSIGDSRYAITSCTSSPALPAGLVVKPTWGGWSCRIEGTPEQATARDTYTITATNDSGSGSRAVDIVVHDMPTPPVPNLINAPFHLLAIGEKVYVPFENIGGHPTSCTVSLPLPDGLEVVAGFTCVIVGTLAEPTSDDTYLPRRYVVTASNATGSSSAQIYLRTLLPPLLPDLEELCDLTVGEAYTIDLPDINQRMYRPSSGISGVGITSCTSFPALPAGLVVVLMPGGWGCSITGTPSQATARATYSITATNDSGPGFATVEIVVHDQSTMAAPSLVDAPARLLAVGEEVTVAFGNTGGAPTSCTARRGLPDGLEAAISADGSSCSIVGALTAPPDDAYTRGRYVITASNAAGSSRARVTLTMLPPPLLPDLEGLCELTVGEAYTIDFPDINQEALRPRSGISKAAITDCSSSPALPAGLIVKPMTDGWGCTIAGTPEQATALDTYSITGTNDSGSDSGTVEIVVYDRPTVAAPSLIDAPARLLAIGEEVSVAFGNTGGAPTGCSALLPLGLQAAVSADGSSCAIVGTPMASASGDAYIPRRYEVTASNAAGSSSAHIVLRTLPPPLLPNLLGLCELTVGEAYTIDFPDINQQVYRPRSGTSEIGITGCTSSPALPVGLIATPMPDGWGCRVTGAPEQATALDTYSITGTNDSGSDFGTVEIVVYSRVAPPVLRTHSQYFAAVGEEVDIRFANTGGAPNVCEAGGSLPNGLSIGVSPDGGSCIITGSPRDVDPKSYYPTPYLISASNAGGSDSVTIFIVVVRAPEIGSLGLQELTVGVSFEATISNSPPYPGLGGAYPPGLRILQCLASPLLPDGLSIYPANIGRECRISGTPTAVSARTSYTITASNSGGNGRSRVDILVNPVAPDLADIVSPQAFTVGDVVSLEFFNAGGAPSHGCTVQPSLPQGLLVGPSSDGGSCAISGSAAQASAELIYSVTASNVAGHSTAQVTIRVDTADTVSESVRFVDLASSISGSCAISDIGQLWCWGWVYEDTTMLSPTLMSDDKDWVAVGSGSYSRCAIKRGGSLHCIGAFGGLVGPNGPVVDFGDSLGQFGSRSDWASISIGSSYMCAITTSGGLYCMGTTKLPHEPGFLESFERDFVHVGDPGQSWSSVSAGTGHACAIDSSGGLYCWGQNDHGTLGLGSDTGDKAVPTRVGTMSWATVNSQTPFTNCAISSDGGLYCWGWNYRGSIATGDASSLVQTEPLRVGEDDHWEQVTLGFRHGCALGGGRLYCWGENTDGALGLGDDVDRLKPTRVGTASDWSLVRTGSAHSCALNTSGELHCWGAGYMGMTGLGDMDHRLAPTRVLVDTVSEGGVEPPPVAPPPVAPKVVDPDPDKKEASRVVQISSGDEYACGIDDVGGLYCWGNGVARAYFRSGTLKSGVVQLGEGMEWASVDAGSRMVCAITTGGQLYCWEVNHCPFPLWGFDRSEVEGGPFRSSFSVAGDDWASVSASATHLCAIKGSGDLHCWGEHRDGRLGTHNGKPGQVGPSFSWVSVSAGVNHTCGITDGGQLHCWGDASRGQLGLGDRYAQPMPMRVGASSDWETVSAARKHTCAVNTQGHLYCWGSNSVNQLGLGDSRDGVAYYPRRLGNSDDWASVGASIGYSCAIKDSGKLYCWGDFLLRSGLTFPDPYVDVSAPVLMSQLSEWTSISVGRLMSCALNVRGVAYCAQPFLRVIAYSGGSLGEEDGFDKFPQPGSRPGEKEASQAARP